MEKDYLLRRSGVAFRYEPEKENAVVSSSSSTKRTATDNVADGLFIGEDKPTVHSEKRARSKRAAKTTSRSPEKQKKRGVAESSSDSDDTADETSTPTAKPRRKPETQTETDSDPRGSLDTVEWPREVSTNDETPPRLYKIRRDDDPTDPRS